MIIDFYTHLISKRVGKILVKGKYYGPGKQFGYPEENAEAESRLALMERYGADTLRPRNIPILKDLQ